MPPLYCVPVGSELLFHSPWRGVSALLNNSAAVQLSRFCHGESIDTSARTALDNIIVQLEDAAVQRPPQTSGPLEPAFLGIIPTRSCNMACRYCDFDSESAPSVQMPLSMAADAVDWMAHHIHSSGRQHLEIHFFGGEPLLAMEVVAVSVHRARMVAAQMGLAPHFEVSTNGLLSPATTDFLGDYFQAVVVSIDGFESDHNRTRPVNDHQGSFHVVHETIQRLSHTPVKLCLRCCITRHSVERMEKITHWLCEAFQPAVINFETVSANSRSRAAGISAPDPYLFSKHCVKSRRIADSYGVCLVYASADMNAVRSSFCPVGRDTLILSPDGGVGSCYLMEEEWADRGMNMNVGRWSAKGNMAIDMQAIKQLRSFVACKPGCEQCFCRWHCAGGCHVKHDASTFSGRYDDFCIQTRLISACFLLDDMGFGSMVNALLGDPKCMEALALNKNDTCRKKTDA